MNSKRVLRDEMKKILNSMSTEEKLRQSIVVQEKILKHNAYKNAKRVCLYLSLKSEVDTSILLKQIFLDSKKCFIPKYKNGTNEMQMIELESLDEYEKLPETNWGIKQFPHDCDKKDAMFTGGLDLILLPGFAFSRDGKRLGKGGGYYDKYLSTLKKHDEKNMPYLIAMSFKEQIKENIPVDETDYIIDEVITA